MCLLSYYPPGVMPVREHLENGARLNPNGFGWAMTEGIFQMRNIGLDAKEQINLFMELREIFPNFYAMFHSRYPGPATLENCHPFRLHDGSVLAHNGELFAVDGDRSDTRVFAEDMMPNWDTTDMVQMAELEDRLGPNKMIIMSKGEPMILNEGLGIWVDGAWYSNGDYTGEPHLLPGECFQCHRPMPDAPVLSQCEFCIEAGRIRKTSLVRC